MSGATGELPSGVRDLSRSGERSPAEQDDRRGPDRGVPSRSYYTGVVKLPGFGHQPQRCTPLQPVGFCRDRGHVMLGRSSCGTRYCPEHWRDWIEEAVVSIVARLGAYRYAQAEGSEKRLLHVVASPDPESRWWTADEFWNGRSDSYGVLREAGCRGGATIAHPYRTSEWGDEFFEQAVESGEWEKEEGKWSLLRDASEEWSELEEFVVPGPHYHTLAACEDFDPDAVADGWVVKNVRSLGRFHHKDVESYREMAQVAYYLLTHAGVEEDRQATTYWGEVHPAAFDPTEEMSAARWEQIQQYARAAVTTKPGESPRSASTTAREEIEGMECSREDCESEVVPIDELGEFLEDDEWLARIDEEQRVALRGVQVWGTLGDRPPPSAAGDRERMLGWLRSTGRSHFEAIVPGTQVDLGSFLVAD